LEAGAHLRTAIVHLFPLAESGSLTPISILNPSDYAAARRRGDHFIAMPVSKARRCAYARWSNTRVRSLRPLEARRVGLHQLLRTDTQCPHEPPLHLHRRQVRGRHAFTAAVTSGRPREQPLMGKQLRNPVRLELAGLRPSSPKASGLIVDSR
jgi:hypothetical protein